MLSESILKHFARLFQGRTDAYGGVNGTCIKDPVTLKTYASHLTGRQSVGVYPLLDNGTCHFAATDIDHRDDMAEAAEKAGRLKAELDALGIPAYIEVSKSKGYHIWIFFSEAVLAKDARRLLAGAWKKATSDPLPEIFPKQDRLNGQAYGNYINLPYFPPHAEQKKRVMTDGGRVLSLEEFLSTVKQVAPDRLKAALAKLPAEETPKATAAKKPGRGDLLPCAKAFVERGADSGFRRPALFRLAAHCHKAGYPQEIAEALIRQVDAKNQPPILQEFGERELLHHVRSAYTGKGGSGYTSLGCDDEAWTSRFCPGRERCPVHAAKPKPAAAVEERPLAFPEEGYCGVAAEFAELYSEYTEVPKSFYYFDFLTYLGTIVSHRVTLDSEIQPQPRLFTVNLGASAETRKSTGLDLTDKFFKETIAEDFTHYGLGSVEGLADRLRPDKGTKEIRPCLLFLDELRLLVDKARLDGSILLPMLCSFFERNTFDNTTKTQKISVRGAYVSLLGACTTETYAQMWTPAFLNIGFTNRLWLVADSGTKRIALPPVIPQGKKDAVKQKLAGILQMLPQRVDVDGRFRYSLTDGAFSLWQVWYEHMLRNVYSRRLDAYGWRLMMLLQLSKGSFQPIDEDTVKRTIKLLDWQLALRELYDPVDAENLAAKVEQLILRNLRQRGALTKRDLQRHCNASRYGLWIFQQGLENLLKDGYARWDKASGTFYAAE